METADAENSKIEEPKEEIKPNEKKKKFPSKKLLVIITIILAIIFILLAVSGPKEDLGNNDMSLTEPLPTAIPTPTPVLIPGKDFFVGRATVKFQPGIPRSTIDAKLQEYNSKVIEEVKQINVYILEVPQGREQEIVTQLTKDGLVEYAELDYTYELDAAPNDPDFGRQYGLTKIQAPQAWDIATGKGIKIAVIDDGSDKSHPDLGSKIVMERNLKNGSHGTHTTGIVAATTNNSRGVAGTCPDCQLMVASGIGSSAGAGHITWAADNGAKVISMSWGGKSNSQTLQNAIDYAWNKGVVLIASAGNTPNTAKHYPAASNNVFSVGATDSSDRKSTFSTYGTWVDISAPGTGIYSTLQGGSYGKKSGTSMSAPMVAGVAGLVWSSSFGTSAQAVVDRLCNTADKITGTGSYFACGRVNAFKAVSGSTATTSPAPSTAPVGGVGGRPTIVPTFACLGSCPTPVPTQPAATKPCANKGGGQGSWWGGSKSGSGDNGSWGKSGGQNGSWWNGNKGGQSSEKQSLWQKIKNFFMSWGKDQSGSGGSSGSWWSGSKGSSSGNGSWWGGSKSGNGGSGSWGGNQGGQGTPCQ